MTGTKSDVEPKIVKADYGNTFIKAKYAGTNITSRCQPSATLTTQRRSLGATPMLLRSFGDTRTPRHKVRLVSLPRHTIRLVPLPHHVDRLMPLLHHASRLVPLVRYLPTALGATPTPHHLKSIFIFFFLAKPLIRHTTTELHDVFLDTTTA